MMQANADTPVTTAASVYADTAETTAGTVLPCVLACSRTTPLLAR
jgi:trimethylamine:corrinoid methyltransferase-like protein